VKIGQNLTETPSPFKNCWIRPLDFNKIYMIGSGMIVNQCHHSQSPAITLFHSDSHYTIKSDFGGAQPLCGRGVQLRQPVAHLYHLLKISKIYDPHKLIYFPMKTISFS